jgi:hypothetical protein
VIPLINGINAEGESLEKEEVVSVEGKSEEMVRDTISKEQYNNYYHNNRVEGEREVNINVLCKRNFIKKIITLEKRDIKTSICYNEEVGERCESRCNRRLDKLNKLGKEIYQSYGPN